MMNSYDLRIDSSGRVDAMPRGHIEHVSAMVNSHDTETVEIGNYRIVKSDWNTPRRREKFVRFIRGAFLERAKACGWNVEKVEGEKRLVYTETGLYFPLAAIFDDDEAPGDVVRGAFNEWELERDEYEDADAWKKDADALEKLATAWNI